MFSNVLYWCFIKVDLIYGPKVAKLFPMYHQIVSGINPGLSPENLEISMIQREKSDHGVSGHWQIYDCEGQWKGSATIDVRGDLVVIESPLGAEQLEFSDFLNGDAVTFGGMSGKYKAAAMPRLMEFTAHNRVYKQV